MNLVVSERICGMGPRLTFYLGIDKNLEDMREIMANYIKLNYREALTYIERFDYIRKFFGEDFETGKDVIEQETSNFHHLLITKY